MKSVLPVIILILSSICSFVQGQSLAGTTWEVRDTSSDLFGLIRFTNDTIYINYDEDSFQPQASYSVNNNAISIHDFTEDGCEFSQTGNYTFAFIQDSLKFTTVSDDCESRQEVLATYYWTAAPNAIAGLKKAYPVRLYPNPGTGMFILDAGNSQSPVQVVLYDMTGRLVYSDVFKGKSSFSLNLGSLAPAIYSCSVFGDEGLIGTTLLKVGQ